MIRTLSVIAAALVLVSCEADTPKASSADEELPAVESSSPLPAVDPTQAQAAVKEIESWDAVIEVMHDEGLAAQWTIGVKDDGTKRYGLAESVCMELSERGLVHDRTWVRVVDRQAVMSNGGDFRSASLGGVECGTGDWIDP